MPDADSISDPAAHWTLQQELFSLAESNLGPRDKSKTIFQPQFDDSGPQIRNTPSLDGVFVEMSRNAEYYWPTAVYEMAHETVHLLDPIPGGTNNLEEGIAVAFSLWVQPLYRIHVEPEMESYLRALELVRTLHSDHLRAGRRIRDHAGALSVCSECQLSELFPASGGVSWQSSRPNSLGSRSRPATIRNSETPLLRAETFRRSWDGLISTGYNTFNKIHFLQIEYTDERVTMIWTPIGESKIPVLRYLPSESSSDQASDVLSQAMRDFALSHGTYRRREDMKEASRKNKRGEKLRSVVMMQVG